MVSEEEKGIMEYSLGWPNCYQNYYVASEDDVLLCRSLVSRGFMIERKGGRSDCPVFHVTIKGERYLCSVEGNIRNK